MATCRLVHAQALLVGWEHRLHLQLLAVFASAGRPSPRSGQQQEDARASHGCLLMCPGPAAKILEGYWMGEGSGMRA